MLIIIRQFADLVEPSEHGGVFKSGTAGHFVEQVPHGGVQELSELFGYFDGWDHLIALVFADHGVGCSHLFSEFLLGEAFNFPAFPESFTESCHVADCIRYQKAV